jgi:hypothetical protein
MFQIFLPISVMFLILSYKLYFVVDLSIKIMFPIFLSISAVSLILSYGYRLYSSLSYRSVDINERPNFMLFSNLKYFNITCQWKLHFIMATNS